MNPYLGHYVVLELSPQITVYLLCLLSFLFYRICLTFCKKLAIVEIRCEPGV